jgi:hypothetical protein
MQGQKIQRTDPPTISPLGPQQGLRGFGTIGELQVTNDKKSVKITISFFKKL